MPLFTTQKTFDQVNVHDDVLLLGKIGDIDAGTQGFVTAKHEEMLDEVLYRWIIVQWKLKDRPIHALPLTESIPENQLFLINFKTPDV